MVALMACNGNRSYDRCMDVADTLMRHDADSAYRMLMAQSDNREDMTTAQRMRYELLLADAQNKAYVDFTTDSVMTAVAEYYDDHGTPNEKMRAHYLLGCTYRDLHDVPMELQCFQDAVDRADTLDKDCDFYTLCAIYGQMADIYHSQYLPNEELITLKLAEYAARKNNDTITELKAYDLRIRAYYLFNDEDSIISITRKARERFLAINNRKLATEFLNTAISIFLDRRDYEQAGYYISLFESESGIIDENGEVTNNNYLYNRGRYFLYLGKDKEAEQCFRKLLENNLYEAGYKGMLLLNEKQNIPDSIAKYAKLYADANDSSYVGKNSETIEQMTAMYNYGRHKREAEYSAQELIQSERMRSLVLFLFILSLLIIAYGTYVYYKVRNKEVRYITALCQELAIKRKEIEELCAERERVILSFNNAIKENRCKDDTIQSLNEKHSNILKSLEYDMQILRDNYNKILMEMKDAKNGIVQEAFYGSSIYKLFYDSKDNGKHLMSNKEWNLFTDLFRDYFSTYYDYIVSFEALSEDHIRVCMLIRVGFKESAMANLMDRTSSRINKLKMQINEKLFNDSSAKTLRNNLKQCF